MMILSATKTTDVSEFASLLAAADRNDAIKSIFVLACDENGYTPTAIDGILNGIQKPVFGGIFPEIIYHCEKWTQGVIVAGLSDTAIVQTIPGLSDMDRDYESLIEQAAAAPDVRTMLVLVDGLSARITALIDALFAVFGLDYNYIGGGAGSLSFQQAPCLFTNDGLIQDSALLVMLPNKSGVGVSHGWTEIAGPFCVTESDRNIVKTLDWKPAFEVYQEIVNRHSGEHITGENFFEIAKGYPFGIRKLDAEMIVRDPIQVGDDNELICVGEVPCESFVHVLTGSVASLVAAAGDALGLGEQSYDGNPDDQSVLFIDCISRVLFLQNDFLQELNAVYQADRPLIGALTLGEIANNKKDYLEFYNKTSVVAVLEN